jgi:predicted lipoprotein with Yx(FWY)xxD motif
MRNAKLIVPVILVVVVAALIGAFAARSMSDSHKQAVVKTRAVGARMLLVNRAGLTLYHLSVERKGHFICTNKACLTEWHPLVVKKGTTPTGAKSLSTVKRPDGRLQVAYKGGPLYTFEEDHKPGDTNGNGFKDVGTWHFVTVSGKAASTPAPQPTSGGGYGGGGY